MGAEVFIEVSRGKDAQEAFDAAVKGAQYDYGHAGYTGTIAEKTEFVMIDCPENKDPEEYAEDLIDESDDRIRNKWGPAGCIKLKEEGEFLFFGVASS